MVILESWRSGTENISRRLCLKIQEVKDSPSVHHANLDDCQNLIGMHNPLKRHLRFDIIQ